MKIKMILKIVAAILRDARLITTSVSGIVVNGTAVSFAFVNTDPNQRRPSIGARITFPGAFNDRAPPEPARVVLENLDDLISVGETSFRIDGRNPNTAARWIVSFIVANS